MENSGLFGLFLIFVTCIASYYGFREERFFEKYCFSTEGILYRKELRRLFTAGFLHINYIHLLLNIVALYSFSPVVEASLGIPVFCLIYFGSLLGGNLLALFIHRNHEDYVAAGASGAISGLIFSCIALFPDTSIGLFGIPGGINSVIFGLVFVMISIFGIRNGKDNIGHEAHLGGAMTGLLISLIMVPQALKEHYVPILIITLPVLAFFFLILKKPETLIIGADKKTSHYQENEKYAQVINEKEIDRILDKINMTGFNSLTRKEKAILNEFAKEKKQS